MEPLKKDYRDYFLYIAIGIAIVTFFLSWRIASSIPPSFAGVDLPTSVGYIVTSITNVFTKSLHFTFSKIVFARTLLIWIIILIICFVAFSGKLLKQWKWDSYYDVKRKESKIKPKSLKIRDDKFSATDLSEMIGLENVKEEIDKIIAYYGIQHMRKGKGLAASDLNLNFVFYGNPGTGKTVIARYIAHQLKAHKILKKGQMFEADRSLLVAPGPGMTAPLVHEVVEQALGGVLFIDEAYTLTATRDEYGLEAINTLLKLMEDYRDELVVIVAGYNDLMQDFIDSNPGLKSRFTRHIYFRDYTPEELVQIFKISCKKRDYSLTEGAEKSLLGLFKYLVGRADANFSNGRLVRNIFEETISRQSIRIGSKLIKDKGVLMEIEEEDIPLVANV